MTPTLVPSPARIRAHQRVRVVLAVVAVLACVPYVVLKVAWLTGSTIGLRDPDLANSTTMEIANLVTLGMELVGATLAVLLVLPVGQRVAAPLLQVPMYVGSGLLGGVLLLVPVQALLGNRGSQPSSEAAPTGPIEPWVYSIVYGGFMVLGISLLVIFADYAWKRWVLTDGWARRLGAPTPAPTRERTIAIAHGAFLVAVCLTGLVVSAREDFVGGPDIVALTMATTCLAGLAMLATGRPRRVRAYVPLLMAYVGSAVVATWGLFFAVILLVPNPLVGERDVPAALVVVMVLRAANGALMLVALHKLRPAPRACPQPRAWRGTSTSS